MSPTAEQLIRDYLNQVSVAARSRLRSDQRRAFLARMRDSIERNCGAPGNADPAEVARVLVSLGDPNRLVDLELARIASNAEGTPSRQRPAGPRLTRPQGREERREDGRPRPGLAEGLASATGTKLPASPRPSPGRSGRALGDRPLTGEIKIESRPITSRWRPGEPLQPKPKRQRQAKPPKPPKPRRLQLVNRNDVSADAGRQAGPVPAVGPGAPATGGAGSGTSRRWPGTGRGRDSAAAGPGSDISGGGGSATVSAGATGRRRQDPSGPGWLRRPGAEEAEAAGLDPANPGPAHSGAPWAWHAGNEATPAADAAAGPAESKSVQSGTVQSGPVQSGPAESGPAESGPARSESAAGKSAEKGADVPEAAGHGTAEAQGTGTRAAPAGLAGRAGLARTGTAGVPAQARWTEATRAGTTGATGAGPGAQEIDQGRPTGKDVGPDPGRGPGPAGWQAGDTLSGPVRLPAELVTRKPSAGSQLAGLASDGMQTVAILWRRSPLQMSAVLVLVLAGLIYPFPVWLVGFVLWMAGILAVLSSRDWDPRDKLAGLAAPVVIALVGTALSLAVGGSHDTFRPYAHEIATTGPVFLRVAIILGAIYLGWQARRGRRAPAVPPWNRQRRI